MTLIRWLEVCATVFMCLFLSKDHNCSYCVDGENTPGANESVSSLSSQYSKRARGDSVEEEEVQEDQQEEECANTHKRQKAGYARDKMLKNLQMTGGYINHSQDVGKRRALKPAYF